MKILILVFILMIMVSPIFAETANVTSDPNISNGMWGRSYTDETESRAVVVDQNGCMWTNCYANEVALNMFSNIGSYMTSYVGTIGVTLEGLWDEPIDYNWIPTAVQLKLSSSDANDALGGTGGITIEIRGLDANFIRTVEYISLTGQTIATTEASFYRVNYMELISAGTSGVNEGDIYLHNSAVSSGVPSDNTKIYSKIRLGCGRSSSTNYTVPVGRSILIHKLQASSGKGKDVEVSLWVKEFGEPWHKIVSDLMYENPVSLDMKYPIVIGAKADLIIKGQSDSADTGISAKMGYIIIDNE